MERRAVIGLIRVAIDYLQAFRKTKILREAGRFP